MITELYTERLHLRKMALADAPYLYSIWSDPDVTKFMNIEGFTDQSQAVDIINYLDTLAQEGKAYRYSIIEKESNRVIGSCGYNTIDFENEKTEIGYDLAKSYWGKGFAAEALSALINQAFHSLQLNRVEAKVEPENVDSIKLLSKLNFTFEGTLRQYEKSKGNFIDLCMYSRLVTD
ncbi:GNAT family N-acetyltransferase [Caldalkalibacillus mannanilyticus]|uniref:GNAT family N-acetyltransferase n=1 Tax=Caldalkalibacillus mannanilyticus TaxID=1418 RepID=UPI000468364D|nr:GNAT family protein [Caldalkalibacillus mannanilyticus]